MADNRVSEAVDIVARRIVWLFATDESTSELWENFPEIGEGDWDAVIKRVTSIGVGLSVTADQFDAAYAFLESRAEHMPEVGAS